MKNPGIIRSIYLYGVSIISIVVMLISTIGLVQLVLNEYVFDVKGWEEMDEFWECNEDTLLMKWDDKAQKNVDKEPNLTQAEKDQKIKECEEEAKLKRENQHKNDVKRDLVQWISMFIVALPLYIFHWTLIKRDHK
ncbi:hypothetical protein HY604_01995 [Candidatus Peregrinibacteria bacterium]|nr:hypothetical protein [Candidatus Peregrinibacteria bacterium]